MKAPAARWSMLAITLCGVVALLARTDMAAQQPTFTASVDAVRLDVLVADRGRVLRGLTAADFEVLDNKVGSNWMWSRSSKCPWW